MTDTTSIHILLVEDNNNLREAITELLTAHGHHVTSVVCAEDVDDTPSRDLPDLYLIDVNLPGENGFSLAQRIRQSQPLAFIAMLTARNQLNDRLIGYFSGADISLIKPVESAELIACIQSIVRRLTTTRLKNHIDERLTLDSQTLRLTGPSGTVNLTYSECLVLTALCRAAGQKLERWQVMQLVDPHDKGLVPANAEMRISSLRKKLTSCGASEGAIRTLRGFGYALTCTIKLY